MASTLVSDHYYPPGRGPHPTLLMRQPYGREIASTVVYAHPTWFARHGYNVVIQDVRGRGDSEGDFYPFRHERDDGAETIRWLRKRPESNGKVGMYGFSYQGTTQLLAASAQPEGLACIAPHMTAHDLYHGWFYHNGALRLSSTLGWGLQMLREDSRRLGLREASEALEAAWVNVRGEPLHAPYRQHPALLQAGLPAYVLNWFDHDHSSRLLVGNGCESVTVTNHRASAACLRMVRYLSERKHRWLPRADGRRRLGARPQPPISDRGAVGSHSVGRIDRRPELRPRGVARYRCAALALVQPLAERFGRIYRRAKDPPLRSRREHVELR